MRQRPRPGGTKRAKSTPLACSNCLPPLPMRVRCSTRVASSWRQAPERGPGDASHAAQHADTELVILDRSPTPLGMPDAFERNIVHASAFPATTAACGTAVQPLLSRDAGGPGMGEEGPAAPLGASDCSLPARDAVVAVSSEAAVAGEGAYSSHDHLLLQPPPPSLLPLRLH